MFIDAERFLSLLDRFEDRYPRYTGLLRGKADNYLAFPKYMEGIRKHLYTTNTVESLGSLLGELQYEERRHFQSQKVLELNIIFDYRRFRYDHQNYL
jgi:transposase-like protein